MAKGELGVLSTLGETIPPSRCAAAYSTRLTVSVPSAILEVDRRFAPPEGGRPGEGAPDSIAGDPLSSTWLVGREPRSPLADLAERKDVAMLCRLFEVECEWPECAEFCEISDKGREGGLESERLEAAGMMGGSRGWSSRGEVRSSFSPGECEVSSRDIASGAGKTGRGFRGVSKRGGPNL